MSTSNNTFRNESRSRGTAQLDILDPTSKMYLDVLVILVNTITCVGGFWGNFVLASVIIKRKKLHTPTNWFVFNLAISDLFIIVITIPLWIMVPKISWPFGEIGCKYLIMPVMEHLTGVCVLTHTAVGVARYVIVKNSKTRQSITDVQVKVTIASIWIISFLFLSAPLMGLFGEFHYIRNSTTGFARCYLLWKNDQLRYSYRILTFTLTYVFPMVATGLSYVKIHQLVSKTLEKLNGQVSAAMFTTRQRQTSQMNTILMTMYVLFAFTTLPLQLFFFLHAFYVIPRDTKWAPLTMDGLFILFYAQVVINPLVLFHMGENYRKEIYKLKLCCCYNDNTNTRLRNFSAKVKDNFQAVGSRIQKSRAMTGSTKLGEFSGRMRLTSVDDRPPTIAESEKKKKKQNYIEKEKEVNGDMYDTNGSTSPKYAPNNQHIYSAINDNLIDNDELSELVYDEVKGMNAYYDDGTLMYIYDKSIGCVSLAHDNGRETSI